MIFLSLRLYEVITGFNRFGRWAMKVVVIGASLRQVDWRRWSTLWRDMVNIMDR